ncbi:Scr1 family TA system antitoxin-like transcriptional regulator [Sphaerisporangium sp. NBC_01403]|uniref:Scr1 family TA system antitoxin-like transcriptional regulator n=1 Tax=Sphaerisporangium sp. NBC_01403 TaxID=2903599 RepID=UPI00386FCE4E
MLRQPRTRRSPRHPPRTHAHRSSAHVYQPPIQPGEPHHPDAYPGLAGPLVIANFDGGEVVHVDNALSGDVIERAADVAALKRLWESLRAEAWPEAGRVRPRGRRPGTGWAPSPPGRAAAWRGRSGAAGRGRPGGRWPGGAGRIRRVLRYSGASRGTR